VQQVALAKALAARGHQVSMVCLDYGQAEAIRIHGVTVHRAFEPLAGIPGTRFFHPRLTGLWGAMRRADAEIYYQRTAGMLTGVVAAFCRRHGRKSVYAGAHDSDFVPGKQYIGMRRDRWLFEYGLRNVDAVLAQNALQRTLCLEQYGRKAHLVRSCYIPPASAGRNRSGDVLWVSTLREFKRPGLLLDIARALPDIQFRMIGGPGSDRRSDLEAYQRWRDQAGRMGNVEFIGFVPFADVEAHFDSASLLVNTSEQEGFPNTFLQAWARGIPTVSFLDPHLPSELAPICTVVRDVPEASRAIRTLITSAVEWETVGARCCRYFLACHTPSAVVPRLERFLKSL
jgi:glycosyltransferase involved in cell wall biosynthesis